MGNDGGSIPTRRELVKEAARNPTVAQLKESQNEQQQHLWNHDPLSQKPLAIPIVSDYLGRLFNKDSVIEYLLPSDGDDAEKKSEQEEVLKGSIKSLKDIVEIKFEIDPADPTLEKSATGRTERWICPITRQELGPAAKAAYLVPCGHAFAGLALKEIAGGQCPQCSEAYAENDIIPIYPTAETEIARLELRVETLKSKGLSHSLRKSTGSGKKRKKNTALQEETPSEDVHNTPTGKSQKSELRTGTDGVKSSDGIKNTSTASLTAKVLEEQEERNKKRKLETNENLKSLFTKTKDPKTSKSRDINFMNRGYSIPGRQ